jgi:DNA recombination-dependent growth factor C
LESTKSIRLTGALQLTLSADLPQAEAMESAEKMERIELRGDALQSVMFAPYSITRLEFEWEQDGQFVLSSANK